MDLERAGLDSSDLYDIVEALNTSAAQGDPIESLTLTGNPIGLDEVPYSCCCALTDWDGASQVGRPCSEGVQQLADALVTSSHLQVPNSAPTLCCTHSGVLQALFLESCDLDDDGGQRLMTALCCNKALRVVNLSTNRLTALSCRAISTMLNCNRTLSELSLAGNPIGDLGCAQLLSAVASHGTALLKLDLSGTLMTDRGCIAACRLLLSPGQQLREFRMARNEITDHGVFHLAQSLTQNCTLLLIDLRHNNALTTTSADAISNAMRSNRTLSEALMTHRHRQERTARETQVLRGVPRERSTARIKGVQAGTRTNTGRWLQPVRSQSG